MKKIAVRAGKLKRANAYPAGMHSRSVRIITKVATSMLFCRPERNCGTRPFPVTEPKVAAVEIPTALR